MSSLPAISTRELLSALRKSGFQELPGRGKGSHHVLFRADPATILTVPERETIMKGTLRAILRQAGMTADELVNLL